MAANRPKVAFLSSTRDRAEFIINLAPPDLEVTYVDNTLPDDEKVDLCKDVQAIITVPADVSTNVSQ